MITRDISDTFSQILQLILEVFRFCFSFLDSITFLGTSLLDFIIAILIIGALFPILFAVVRGGGRNISKRSKSDD